MRLPAPEISYDPFMELEGRRKKNVLEMMYFRIL
jgi:hypothetical protein